ncbi:hypothetical protein GF327_02900 [Candidatus Woesearchaeota archaeon]|nr:hypothetical protein [Candidatus Woesearchaeota archaeon]
MLNLIYVLAAMILYDLYLHIIELIHGNWKRAWKKFYYWPPSKIFENKSDKFYNIFWTFYWIIALTICILIITA